MMVEHGFVSSLESKFMQINEVIWRAVRIIVDVKLSQGEMKFDEAVEMLVKETGMSREAALERLNATHKLRAMHFLTCWGNI